MDLATIVLSLGLLGSTVAEVETTMGRRELNPIMRPFADSRAEMYAVKTPVNLGVAVLSHKLRHSPRRRDKIIGWALPAFTIAVQSVAAIHNHNSR